MNRKYNLKLDLQFRCNNSTMKFNQFDNNTSDFFMRITNGGNLVDIEKAIVVLAIIKPSGKVASQFVEIENGLVYADLKPNMRDEIGTYTAQAMLILEDERVVTDVIGYEVEEDKIFSLLNDSVGTSEEFTLLTDMLNRLSTIETSEEQRVINEAERILSEENRKIEEAKRVEAELIRQHEEADRAKYDATRESNENIRKQNESIRLANETNRIDEETKRVEEETKRVEAEQLRKDNYNFMTEDEERRRSEANAHKEAEALRVQAETNRVNEEAKRRTTEQARILAENTRVSNENTRKANETARQTNETKRVEAETQRQNRYNSFIADAEANASNFENYTNTAKAKEEERKSNELDRKSQEVRRISNEVERISNENTRKANENAREKNETSRQYVFENKVNEVDKKIIEINATKDNFVSNINTKVDTKISEIEVAKSDMTNTVSNKINEVENRFNALTSKQQQDAEVVDARDGETSLKARLDRDIEKAKQVYVNVEGSHISTDSSSGYAKDVEILGNTIQNASNLADIRSVGDKVEGQELYEIPVLSVGKNLIDYAKFNAHTVDSGTVKILKDANSIKINGNGSYASARIKLNLKKGEYIFSKDCVVTLGGVATGRCFIFIDNKHTYTLVNTKQSQKISLASDSEVMIDLVGTWGESATFDATFNVQLEEGTVATPCEPYIEDKLTILSPVQLEKGDILYEDGTIVKVIKDLIFDGSENWTIRNDLSNDTLSAFELREVSTINQFAICNLFNVSNYHSENELVRLVPSNGVIVVNINNSRLESNDAIGFKKFLSVNNLLLKVNSEPTKYKLPHDQQIKLRTFANKTNISFLTEIEGTIKAQVPKSLGATVNTHTEQIRSLNNELNRVKKLEESTVSTVTTESDFTTVEATSNGYFEDVKLEGKTLVNLCNLPSGNITIANTADNGTITPLKQLNSSDTLYLTFNCTSINSDANLGIIYRIRYTDNTSSEYYTIKDGKVTGNKQIKIVPKSNVLDLCIYLHGDNSSSASATISDVMLMYEKDYDAQNPPSYFEGLKSVGEDTDEIVVSSVKGDGNLLMPLHTGVATGSYNKNNITFSSDYSMSYVANAWGQGVSVDVIGVVKGETYVILCDTSTNVCVRGANALRTTGDIQIHSNKAEIVATSTGIGTITFKNATETGNISCTNLRVIKKGSKEEFSVLNQDKKRLLYYNEETQTWEKPILREWDSIEKHANGKYYYHQRSGEVVFDGSENWNNDKNSSTMSPETYRQSIQFNAIDIPSASFDTKTSPNIISDLLPTVVFGDVYSYNRIGISISGTDSIATHIIINNNFTDVTELKQWLQTNNLTVVYQLAEEKVYECTNIDLITYNGETNFIVESGVLSPRTTLKVHNNISNVVSLLQKKVSLLESNVKASQEVQDMMILETDMRMLDIELALMEFIPINLNLGGSDMLRSATYFNFLKNHIINETYEKEYLENVMNKYLATGRINQDEYNELYKMLYPPVYDIELPIEY